MKKKILCLLSLFSIVSFGCLAPICASVQPIYAAEEVVAPSIVLDKSEHGSVTIKDAKESYAAGDVVTLDIKADNFYVLNSLSVNGVALAKNADGEYKFALISGENKVSASFKIDEKLLGDFADAYVAAQQGDWKNVFTVENLLILISFLFNSGIAIALVNVFAKYKKSGTIDRKELIDAVNKAIPDETKNIVSNIVKDTLMPYFTQFSAHMDDVVQMCKKFIQAFLYSLDDTMDSKEKIISLLSGLNLSDQNSIDEMKAWFKNEAERLEQKTEDYKRLIAEMKEANENARKESSIISPKEESKPEKEELSEDSYDGTSI